MGKLLDWGLNFDEMDQLVTDNPSLQGMMLGYAAELKLGSQLLTDDRFSGVRRPDPHARKDQGDFVATYRGVEVTIEVKSLQTATVVGRPGGFEARYQCDASDRRPVKLPNGMEVVTTCLAVGTFDLLAVNLFAGLGKWVFAFAKNVDLPRVSGGTTPKAARPYLLKSASRLSWPLTPPYSTDAFALLDELVAEKRGRRR